jgi:hypothetical protein
VLILNARGAEPHHEMQRFFAKSEERWIRNAFALELRYSPATTSSLTLGQYHYRAIGASTHRGSNKTFYLVTHFS